MKKINCICRPTGWTKNWTVISDG